MIKTISRIQRLQLTVIVAALVAPLLSFNSAPAHAVAATCAQGGVCQVGDIGPGGGKVFWVDETTFTQIGASGTMCTTNCKYLEAAPNTWSGGSSDPTRTWATDINSNRTTAVTGADGTAIGTGYQNSLDIVAQSGNVAASSAAVAARGYTPTVSGITYTDWFLPSLTELTVLYFERATVGGFVVGPYWSSSENNLMSARTQNGEDGSQNASNKNNTTSVRPVRAFAPATKISITRAAVGTQRGTAFTTQPQITIQYTNNDTVTVSSAVVTASISSGGTLIGTTTATASSGVATFSNLGVNGTVGNTYTISYTALDLPIASATVTLTGTTCDGATFTCQVGDTGPGGGKIYYVAPTTFTQIGASGTMCTTNCKYLEVAPNTWSGGSSDPSITWATDINSTPAAAYGTVIGTGYENSLKIVAQYENVAASSAAVAARGYRPTVSGTTYTDWYLPSKDELNQLYLQKTAVGGVWAAVYWSSTESNANAAWTQNFGIGDPAAVSKDTNFYVRPVRAFGVAPTTISIANVVIPAPVLGATPVNSITSNGQFTTAITWSGSPTTFAASTAYTATVTVTPVAGYTLGGVVNGFFTVNGSAANGVINSTNIATTGVAPYAVAADGQGNIYLANKSANNVTKITPIGVTSILGTTGTSPFAISVAPDGNVYTANQGSNNVTKLTAQGISTVLMVTGNGPKSILVDAAGSVYTANSDNDDVTKKTAQGNQTKINVAGSSPSGITIDAAGNIYTSNIVSNNVTKTTPQEVSTIFGSTGLQPYAITIDSAGNIYTANYSSNNVTKITPQGVSSILGTTSGGPNAIAIDAAGNIYTANYSSDNVTKITPQGVSSTYGTTGNYPTGITVDSEGNIYTANYGSSNVTRFSGTNSGVFTYQFPSTAAASAPVVYVAPTPVPYLKTLTTPKLRLSSGKLLCTPGTYNAGYTLDGVIQGSATALYSPSAFTYNLLINGITQTALAVTSSSTSHSWTMPTTTSGALITCSVTVTANGITNTDKSGDNTSGASSALTTQSAAIATANVTYSAALSANTTAYQKALVDNRTKWRSDTVKIRTDYYAERGRIKPLPSTRTTRALSSAALKAYTAALKRSAADYKASGPAALAAKDVADKAALDAKTTAIAKANAAYGTAIESIGYGVLVP